MTGYSKQQPLRFEELPALLYHGSAYCTEVLKPGYFHSWCLQTWGERKSPASPGEETNHYLYASAEPQVAEDCAALRTLERSPWGYLGSFQGETGLVLQFSDSVSLQQLAALECYVYTIAPRPEHCWIRNQELNSRHYNVEFRTRRVVTPAQQLRLDLRGWLQDHRAVVWSPPAQKAA